MNYTPLRRRIVTVAILLLFSSLWASKSATLGTQNDEGVHVTAATLIAHGKHVYRDFYENRTPGVEWILGALFSLTKPDVRLARLLTNQISLLTLASLVALSRLINREIRKSRTLPKSGSWASSYIACALFGFTPLVIFWSRFAMLEHWQTALGMLAVMTACFGAVTSRLKYWFASGALAASSLLFKQPALTTVIAIGVFLFLRAFTLSRKRALREALYWFLGLILPLILFLIVLTFLGSLPNFLLFLSGLERLAPFTDLPTKISAWSVWAIRQPLFPLALAGLFILVLPQISSTTLVVIWAAVEQIALFAAPDMDLGWGGFSHYAIPSTAVLAILGGTGYFWIQAKLRQNRNPLITSVIFIPLVFTIPGWLKDIRFSTLETTYPMSDFQAEEKIGQAISAITPERESVLILANSVFYHHAGRYPANLFFHYPEYLPTSSLGELATIDIQSVLRGGEIETLVVSRMHLDTRLPSEIKSSLWDNWTPVARFPYSYQGDVFIFLQLAALPSVSDPPLAKFEGEIMLLDAKTKFYGQNALLVRLFWWADETLSEELSVFTHLVNSNGELVAQNDSIPGVGFRPVTSWRPGERIEDAHWITYDRSLIAQGFEIRVGLYHGATGERIRMSPATQEPSYYVLDPKPK